MYILKIIQLYALLLVGFVLLIFLLPFPIFLLLRTCNKLPDTKIAYLVSFFIILITCPIIYSLLTDYGMELWIKFMIIYPCVCLLCYCFAPVLYRLYKAVNPSVASGLRLQAGARSEKYNHTLFSTLCFVVAAILLIICVRLFYVGNEGFTKSLSVNMFFVFIGLGLMYRRMPAIYKAQPKGIEEVKYASFVLFLRGFKHEKEPFYFGAYLSEFGKTNEGLKASYSSGNITMANFELFFSRQIKIYIGELVGFGNPEDIEPHESAKMVYTLDDWRKQFFSLAQTATCIVIQPCLTESLQYELAELLKSNLAYKVYFFTKPLGKNFYRKYLMWLLDFSFNRKLVGWGVFQKMLHQIGFTSNINVQKGAVVSFNENNETVLLKENCKRPSDYIKVVKADLVAKGLLK